jgi:hypothetical protein
MITEASSKQKYRMLISYLALFGIGAFSGIEIGKSDGLEEIERLKGVGKELYSEQQSLRFQLENELEVMCGDVNAKDTQDLFAHITCATKERASELASSDNLRDKVIGRICLNRLIKDS